MSGFSHSLLRFPFLALIVQNILAATLTMNWTGHEEKWSLAWGAVAAVGGSTAATVAGGFL